MADDTFTVRRLDVYAFRAAVSAPVVTSFATLPSRAIALLRVEDADGAVGWGEIWGNFPPIAVEYRAQLAAYALPPHVLGASVDAPHTFSAQLAERLRVLALQSAEFGPIESVLAAFNQALWDITARRKRMPLRVCLNASAPQRVPAYASGLNPDDCEQVTARARAEGFRAFKLKIGFGDDVDGDNLTRLRRSMDTGERLFVDANQRFSFDQACARLPMLEAAAIDWLEEPMRADAPASAWRDLASRTEIPLAGGENLRDRARFEESLEWFTFVQPDVGKWGGIDGCLMVARNAVASGRCYCPHWLAGGVGLAHSAHLLAAAGGDGLLEIDANENPLRSALIATLPPVRDGCFDMGEGHGIGIDPPLTELERWKTHHQSFHD